MARNQRSQRRQAGWNVLGFAHLEGRAADYLPGSPDLEQIIELMTALAAVSVPDGHAPVKYAEDGWKSHVSDLRYAEVLTGPSLIHTDWIDPVCWLLRLMAHGHTADQAEALARCLPAYAAADTVHVDVLVL